MATTQANPWAYESSDTEESPDLSRLGDKGADDTEEERGCGQDEKAANKWEADADRRFSRQYGGWVEEEMGAREMTAGEHAARVQTVRIAVDAAARLHNRALVESFDVSAALAGATVGCKKKDKLCPVCNRAPCDNGNEDYHEWTRYDDGSITCAGAREGNQWYYQICDTCGKTSGNHSQLVCKCSYF